MNIPKPKHLTLSILKEIETIVFNCRGHFKNNEFKAFNKKAMREFHSGKYKTLILNTRNAQPLLHSYIDEISDVLYIAHDNGLRNVLFVKPINIFSRFNLIELSTYFSGDLLFFESKDYETCIEMANVLYINSITRNVIKRKRDHEVI